MYFLLLSLRDLAFCRKKQVSGGFGLTSVLVIFRTLDSSSFCMGETFDLLLNSSRSLPFTSSVVRSSSGLVSSAVISNSLFLNIDVPQINRLQAIQNALARAVTKTPKHHHITPVLKKLHWLKIPQRIEYKV